MSYGTQILRILILSVLLSLMLLIHSELRNYDFLYKTEDSDPHESPPLLHVRKRSIQELLFGDIIISSSPSSSPSLDSSSKNDLPLTATLVKPLLTSTPFPTLTTRSQSQGSSNSMIKPTLSAPHITDWSDVPEHFLLRLHYNGNFSLLNEDLCEKKVEEDNGDGESTSGLKLLILVTSAINHFEQRNNVRMTWGNYGQRKDVQFAFVIGDSLLPQFNDSVKLALQQEIEMFGDFIIASFADTYRNLTLKTLHMLDWASTYCGKAKYFLKTDDDVFLNIPGILEFIDAILDSDTIQPKIYGHVFSGHFPKRDTAHRHHLTYDIYPHNVSYPNFTSGPAYLMSMRIVKPLLDEALKLPFFPLEDVLITGFCAMYLRIPRVEVDGFINEIKNPVDLPACDLLSVLAGMTDGSAIEMSYVWYNYMMGRTICTWRLYKEKKSYTSNLLIPIQD